MEASKQTKGKGLQRIEIKRVEHKSACQVTFSKRKKGIFSKTSEFCVLCGAEFAIIIMSPHMRAFTFGHPNPDAVLDGFITGEAESLAASTADYDDEKLGRLKQEYKELLNRLKDEEKKHDEIVKKRDNDKANGVFWWDNNQYSIDDMELNELEHYFKSLEKLKKSVRLKSEELAVCKASNYFLNQFNANNVSIDFGSKFDDIGCLLEGMNQEDFLRNLDF